MMRSCFETGLPSRRTDAFTILELIIAAAILSALLSSSWFAFDSLRRNLDSGRDTFTLFLRGRIISRKLENFISQASPYRQRNLNSAFNGKRSEITLTSLYNPEGARVPVFVHIFKKDGEVLLETSDYRWLTDKIDARKPVHLPFVYDIEFRYRAENGYDWLEEWDRIKKSALPQAVRADLKLRSPDGIKLSMRVFIRTRLDRDPSIP